MTKARPSVSVYLPTHNRAALLARAIESVLSQSFTDFELIVVDDGSRDDTPDIITRFCARDSRVKGLRTAESQGAPAARNMAIRAASGTYITGLDDDDEMRPQRIQELITAFRPEFSLVSSSSIRQTSEWSQLLHPGERIITLDALLHRNIIGTQALTLRDRIISIGGFDTSFQASQDYDLWIRLVKNFGPAKRISSPSYIINEHLSASRISDRKLLGAERILEKHRGSMKKQHIQSRQLEMLMMSEETLRTTDFVRLANAENLADACRYFVTCRAPWLRRVASLARRVTSLMRSPRD
jgi:glycosyltransferase involved in cell wall biosynthesis